ncbi:hypothetical protein AB0E74_13230 [Streptomyces sp. NPDC030392]|uniref:hypothetical protein n=1 Tax=Streptomyces sp. NPDC030392 TaxID=3155468 RepID=UPI0033D84601
MTQVFPYPTLFGDIELDVAGVTVDGAGLPFTQISRAERTIALHQSGRERWHRATVRLRATLPDPELAQGPWSDVVCLAVLSEKATNTRVTARLDRAADGTWTGAVDVDRSVHHARATLGLTVVATVDGVRGRVIGTVEVPWFVDVQAAVPVRRREIEIVEIDFREGPLEWLRPFKDVPWLVETTGDVPTVYLNLSAVEGLVEILGGAGGTPAEKLIRDLTAGQIAQDAWTAMFHTAIADLDVDEDGSPVLPTGWRESVLRAMLPDVVPKRRLEDALYDINERRTQGFGWSELQTGIQYAAAKRSRVAKQLTSAVRSIGRNDENTQR